MPRQKQAYGGRRATSQLHSAKKGQQAHWNKENNMFQNPTPVKRLQKPMRKALTQLQGKVDGLERDVFELRDSKARLQKNLKEMKKRLDVLERRWRNDRKKIAWTAARNAVLQEKIKMLSTELSMEIRKRSKLKSKVITDQANYVWELERLKQHVRVLKDQGSGKTKMI
ncbi:hypothetical protein K435DRAFT_803000 [Dendrothele bispora CBS 962.96]|uniref:Uncharacterized protein n=1 Tax=Dendrothele bispora (strain CBS 962.96) TaxID=1314807 RepID=A0A4S8LJH3_DENBC|nr:hypothetical protein K435DRAFT_803000 [Dendrothele bispora CBS 962.96]